jgi:hypothetical protein
MNIAGYSDWAVVQQVLQSGAAVFIGSLLLSAAFLKARDRAGFLAAIQALDSAIVGSATGDAVIAAEAAAGLLTLIPATRDLGLWLAVAVFAAFALTFARLALRGIRYAQCGCLGPSSTERPTSVARIIWMSCSLAVISAWPAASPESSPPIALAGAAGIGLGLLALSAVYVVDALRANTAASFEWRRR